MDNACSVESLCLYIQNEECQVIGYTVEDSVSCLSFIRGPGQGDPDKPELKAIF